MQTGAANKEHGAGAEGAAAETRDPEPSARKSAQAASAPSDSVSHFAASPLAILNALSSPVALLDSSGVIRSVNNEWRRFAEIHGLRSPDAGVGENYLDVCEHAQGEGAEGASEVAAGIRAVLGGQSAEFSLEYPCRSAAGSHWFRLAVTPLDGAPPSGAMVAHVEITDHHLAHEAVAEVEERFRATFEQAAVGLAHVGPEGRFLRVNDKLCKITGYPRGELLELTWQDLTIPEDLAEGQEALAAMLAGEKTSYVAEKRYRRKDGDVFWVNLVTTLVRDGDGAAKYFISVFEDVTMRKQIEEKLWRQASRLAAIVESQQDLAATTATPEALLGQVAQMAHRLIDSDGAVFERLEGEELVLHAASGMGAAHLGMRFQMATSFSGAAFRANRTLICEDVEKDSRVDLAACRELGICSMAATVLRGESGPIGIITVLSRQPSRFGKSDANSLELLAQSLSTVLQRKLAEAETQAHAVQQAAVSNLGQWALAGVRLSQLRDKAVEIIAQTFDVEFCELLELLPDGKSLKLVAGFGWQTGLVGRLRVGVGLASQSGYTLTADAPVIVEDLAQETRFTPSSIMCEHGVVSGISVVIPGEKGHWGVLGAHSSRRRTFTKADANFFQSIANVIAEATHRVHADEAIRLSETRYRRSSEQLAKIMDSSLDVICSLDAMGRFVQVSAACEEVWGYAAEELIGTSCYDMVVLEDVVKYREIASDVMAGNPARGFENRIVRRDGMPVLMNWSAHWSDAEQTMFCVARDVTEAKQAAEASQQLSRRLAATLNSITDAFFTVDRDWRFTYINQEALALVRKTHEDLLGKKLWEEFSHLAGSRTEAEYRRAMAENRSVIFEEYYQRLNLWLEVRIYPSEDGLTVNFRDVTERKRTTDRLEEQAALLDKARDAILVRDLDQCITYWNNGAVRIYGWTAEEVLGRRVADLLYRDTTIFQQATDSVLRSGEWTGELAQITKDGRDIIIEARWNLVRDSEGRPKSILAINTDITDQKKLEQQFLRAQRMESIGTLAGGIAHDLNNVLTPITMAIELLGMTVTDDRSKQVLATIATSAKRGAEMVGQVLSFARGMEGRRIWIDVKGLIQDIERIAKDTFPKNINIRAVISAPIWALQGDPTQLQQVLLNFCLNARDAMPDGGAIVLSAENVLIDEPFAAANIEAKVGPSVMIQVEDTGTGIPQAIIDKIFDPFFTTKELGKGTGLGLSTSLAIVKSHGGFVRVFSEPGKGSRFRIYLPALPEAQRDAPRPLASELPYGEGETVLVVDDEPSVRDVTRQTLEAFGYHVLVAVDGAEAVMMYAQHKDTIDVVLTDMMMPVMGGATTIQVLMKMNPEVRIIAASGITSNEAVAKAAGQAVKAFLPKPYNAEAVLTVLRRVLTNDAAAEG